MSDIRDAILAEFPRLRALWPALNAKPEHLSEVGRAIMRYSERITREDVAKGFDDAIAACPTTGWAPGPHEILGCVLAVADVRRRNEAQAAKRARREHDAPARETVVGRHCSCGAPLALLTDERALWCDECRRVVVVGGSRGAPRYTLDEYELARIETVRTCAAPGGPELARAVMAHAHDEDTEADEW